MTRKLPQAHQVDAHQVALLVVDMQRDFMPGGALAVAGAAKLVPAINHYIAQFSAAGATIVLSRDWHAPNHHSFATAGGRWPVHCLAGSPGAEFVPALQFPDSAIIVSKGVDPETHGYSAFEDTGLGHLLTGRGIRELWVAGVATEFSVRSSVLDALYAGFLVTLLVDAIAGMESKSGDSDRVIDEMAQAGAVMHSGSRRRRLIRKRLQAV